MNREWHTTHVLGRRATQIERIAWHREHQKRCACRPIPATLLAEMQPRSPPRIKSKRKSGPAEPRGSARATADSSVLDREFTKLKAEFARDSQVTSGGKGFGAGALKVGGKIFAMVTSKQEFVVKLPRDRVAELVGAGHGHYFDPGKGKLMKEWLALTDAPARWLALAREAKQFAEA